MMVLPIHSIGTSTSHGATAASPGEHLTPITRSLHPPPPLPHPNGFSTDWHTEQHAKCKPVSGRVEELERPLSHADVLNDWNFEAHVPPAVVGEILPIQTRLAQIVILEMLHVRVSPARRRTRQFALHHGPSARVKYSNKVCGLAGEFLLGHTSAVLSRLGESEVVDDGHGDCKSG